MQHAILKPLLDRADDVGMDRQTSVHFVSAVLAKARVPHDLVMLRSSAIKSEPTPGIRLLNGYIYDPGPKTALMGFLTRPQNVKEEYSEITTLPVLEPVHGTIAGDLAEKVLNEEDKSLSALLEEAGKPSEMILSWLRKRLDSVKSHAELTRARRAIGENLSDVYFSGSIEDVVVPESKGGFTTRQGLTQLLSDLTHRNALIHVRCINEFADQGWVIPAVGYRASPPHDLDDPAVDPIRLSRIERPLAAPEAVFLADSFHWVSSTQTLSNPTKSQVELCFIKPNSEWGYRDGYAIRQYLGEDSAFDWSSEKEVTLEEYEVNEVPPSAVMGDYCTPEMVDISAVIQPHQLTLKSVVGKNAEESIISLDSLVFFHDPKFRISLTHEEAEKVCRDYLKSLGPSAAACFNQNLIPVVDILSIKEHADRALLQDVDLINLWSHLVIAVGDHAYLLTSNCRNAHDVRLATLLALVASSGLSTLAPMDLTDGFDKSLIDALRSTRLVAKLVDMGVSKKKMASKVWSGLANQRLSVLQEKGVTERLYSYLQDKVGVDVRCTYGLAKRVFYTLLRTQKGEKLHGFSLSKEAIFAAPQPPSELRTLAFESASGRSGAVLVNPTRKEAIDHVKADKGNLVRVVVDTETTDVYVATGEMISAHRICELADIDFDQIMRQPSPYPGEMAIQDILVADIEKNDAAASLFFIPPGMPLPSEGPRMIAEGGFQKSLDYRARNLLQITENVSKGAYKNNPSMLSDALYGAIKELDYLAALAVENKSELETSREKAATNIRSVFKGAGVELHNHMKVYINELKPEQKALGKTDDSDQCEALPASRTQDSGEGSEEPPRQPEQTTHTQGDKTQDQEEEGPEVSVSSAPAKTSHELDEDESEAPAPSLSGSGSSALPDDTQAQVNDRKIESTEPEAQPVDGIRSKDSVKTALAEMDLTDDLDADDIEI